MAEPPKAQESEHRFNSLDGRAAVLWRPNGLRHGQRCTLIRKGRTFVVVEIDGIWVVSYYVLPNSTRGEYLESLDELGEVVHTRNNTRTIVGGDFNARSGTWDPFGINNKCQLIEEWAAELDLRIMNEGEKPTLVKGKVGDRPYLGYVRPRGARVGLEGV